jgi:hypothetical protein
MFGSQTDASNSTSFDFQKIKIYVGPKLFASLLIYEVESHICYIKKEDTNVS